MVVFDGVCYSLSPSLSPTRRNELAAVLDLNGASPHPPYTHLIALPASHAHNATNDPALKLVTDRWVDRSVVMGKRQSEQYYSPDPAMIFSGVVACATDLSSADLEVLSAGITALGGQWRIGLTRDVTHLFALRTGSDKYNTALHFAPQTHMCILTPHWFDDAVRLGRRIPEAPYSWPDPLVLRPGVILNLDDDPLTTDGKRKRKPAGDTDGGDVSNALGQSEHIRVWAGRRILLSTSLELAGSSRGAIEAGIQRAGGVVVPIAEDVDEDAEEKAVDDCDVLVTRWRSGKSYFKAARASRLIGTLSWLFNVESSGTLHSPFDSLVWYPTPRGGIPGLIDCEISVTNYTGAARDYLKRLIVLAGAKFTPSMSQSNKVLVAGFQPSPKTVRALSWSIPVVNHTWLEDCIVEWQALTVGLERYIVYPPGIDFGKVLMTRHDGPPSSQSVSSPRSSGGAVPGGCGVATVNVEQEESRDAEYRARALKGRGALGLSTKHEALANDIVTEGPSIIRLDDDGPTGSRARAPSRGGSVKKTPSSPAMVRRRSVSTPMTASAMGAFVDHVIEISADDDNEDVGGKRPARANGKQRMQTSLAGLRVAPRDTSRSSSPSLDANARDLGEESGSANDKDKSKGGDGVKDMGKWRTRLVCEEDDNDDTPQPVPKPGPSTGENQASAQASKRRPRAKRMTIGSDTDAGEGERSEGSVPPRRVNDARSMTPVKSGMKPRPRSKSKTRGESGDEVGIVAETGMGTGKQREVAKHVPQAEIASKGKRKGESVEVRKEEKVAPRTRSRTCSPPSHAKASRTPKRRLSVVVPSVPKDYYSSQSVDPAMEFEGESGRVQESDKKRADADIAPAPRPLQLAPAASLCVVAAEASTSSKRGRPSVAKASDAVGASRKSRLKPSASRDVTKTRADDNNGDTNKEGGDDSTSMIIDPFETSTSRGGPRRGAANKATMRLREEIMPDVVSFEMEQKQAKRRRSAGWDSVALPGGEDEEKVEKSGKRRKVMIDVEEEGEEAEVEDVVLVPPTKSKSMPTAGKGKARTMMAVGADEDVDAVPSKKNRGGSEEKKGTRGQVKELVAIRLMTTGVTLSDDVIKRLTKLSVQMTMKPTDCTHLVAKGIVRTEKFLCAMSVSPYILTEEWANASAKGGKLLPEKDYFLSDAAAEQKWAFKLADAMARAKRQGGGSSLFKQMTFYVTPKVSVDTKLLRNVVSAGGGQVQTSTMPTARILKGKANRYVVSCPEDRAIWRPLAQEGFEIYSPELVLRGALRQEIEWEREECLVAG